MCVVVFTIEYALKMATAQPSLRAFVLSGSHLLDVLTLVPYYVGAWWVGRYGAALFTAVAGFTPPAFCRHCV